MDIEVDYKCDTAHLAFCLRLEGLLDDCLRIGIDGHLNIFQR
jgi:hypothetical protein